MEIETDGAAEHFFPSPSFTQIYSEAVTNALDANATEVSIEIEIRSFPEPETLRITISDDGIGFTDENFERFKRLLKPRDRLHKGVGRLVYLRYFTQVDVNSVFAGGARNFSFSRIFDGTSDTLPNGTSVTGSTLTFKGFCGDRLKTYDDLRPKAIKEQLLIELLPRLYNKKRSGQTLRIDISMNTAVGNPERDFMSDTQSLGLDELPELEEAVIRDPEIDLFDEITMGYRIDQQFGATAVVTVVSVDDRSIDLNLITPGSLPPNHSAIFLFSSPYFIGKADSARQRLELKDDAAEKSLLRVLRKHVAATIAHKIPAVGAKNESTRREFENRFPHLLGYFEEETVGLIQRDEAIESAQRRFFREQKEILESDHLDDAKFLKSLDVSSRTLTEYILYRTLIIHKLRTMDKESSENEIHNLIAPRYETFRGSDFLKGVYTNNAWLLDDKFMTFSTILSEARMDTLIREITLRDEVERDDSRPDISLIFSADPESNKKVDVVVVEVKKRSDDEKENLHAITQLLQRAEKLATSCPNIQRIWYYGLINIDDALSRRLTQYKWAPLFSKGQMYYQEFSTPSPSGGTIPTPTFLLSFDAVIEDADARNSTFLKILREEIKERNEIKKATTAVKQGLVA